HSCNSQMPATATAPISPYPRTRTFRHGPFPYTTLFRSKNACVSTTSGTITEPEALVASSTASAILCHGGNSTVTVSATGGTTPYTRTSTRLNSSHDWTYTVTFYLE